MTIKRTSKSSSITSYSDLGLAITNTESEIELSYDTIKIVDFDGERVTAEFRVSLGDAVANETFKFNFAYSGDGNPFNQAEAALSAYFAKKDEEEKQAAETQNDDSATTETAE